MLLYIHVPFCRRKCPYCAFYSVPIDRYPEGITLWKEALLEEMRRVAETARLSPIESIFLGGGTPSLLSPQTIGSILDGCASYFPLADGIEISMEANPDSVSSEAARGFRLAGVNRVSLGVQALNDQLLHAIGRIHSKKQAIDAVDALRSAGFDNIGMDLMWGLPGESCSSWREQLLEAAAIRPEHLSCYGLTLEEGTPLHMQRPQLPSEADLEKMYMDCGEILEQNGYSQYEISNYALPGCFCRHNLGYWLGKDYCGFGPSAVSCIDGTRRKQPSDLKVWIGSVMRQEDAAEEEHLSQLEKTEEFLMLQLRTAEGFSFSDYAARTGKDLRKVEGLFLELLEKEKLASCSDGRLRLTRRGMLLSNTIISRLFDGITEQP